MNSTCEENKSSPYRQTLQIQNRTGLASAASVSSSAAAFPFVRFPFPFSFSFLSWMMMTCTDWTSNSCSARDEAISAPARVVHAYHALLESCAQVVLGVTSDQPTPEKSPFPSRLTPTRKAPLCDELL